ncbi:phytoene/squalene synthase family protein [Frankia sp. Cas3]|uniref:phytoene/squalene synthase family protein n=1 Tax=Frankia sp. Cas3 TaxID=3073926 RepID=UPI002AD5736D|nr:phytoene/squalene synthase family protein [Frankia sp. Cas3]
MRARELTAAGITTPELRRSYLECRRLNAAHGRTYFLATLLLPAWKRPYVHALYGFARYADEIVDDLDSTLPDRERAAWLHGWSAEFLAQARSGLRAAPRDGKAPGGGGTGGGGTGGGGTAAASVLPAVIDTIGRWGIPLEYFRAFLQSMAMDLTVTSYATWEDLMAYVHGSAVVIGLQMVHVLEAAGPAALPYARDLGAAFQLANFIRDVGEDLLRGRVYLPRESLDLFGVTPQHLRAGVVDGPVRRLLAFEITRARELFRAARPGIRLLHPTSRDCVGTAFRLYSGILDEVERADYQVLDRRVSVGLARRVAVAGPGIVRAAHIRRIHADPGVRPPGDAPYYRPGF